VERILAAVDTGEPAPRRSYADLDVDIPQALARVPELRLTHPLERGCTDFLALRIGAYLDAAGARGSDRRLPVFRALHWISLRRSFKSAMGAFATVTGVYHEMHLICTKV